MPGARKAPRAGLRKRDVSARTRRIERRLKARLRRLFPDIDHTALMDAIRPTLALAARDNRPDSLVERHVATLAIGALSAEIAEALSTSTSETNMKSDLIDLDVEISDRTERAVLVR